MGDIQFVPMAFIENLKYMGFGMLGIFVVIGAIIGWLAGKLMNSKGGLLRNILLGIAGSAVGGFLGGLLNVEPTSWIVSMLLSVGGACLIIWLQRKLFGKKK